MNVIQLSGPEPPLDGLPGIEGPVNMNEVKFGFKTLAQLQAWFDKPRQAVLKAAGFNIKTYQAKQVFEGRHQLAFVPAKAEQTIPWPN